MKVIAGPCVVEDLKTTFRIAEILKERICPNGDIDFYFKASYKKANRTSLNSFTGIPEAIEILKFIKNQLDLKICTDVHSIEELEDLDFVDVIQIPAFLCRQTDLIVAAAKTGKIVNIKKGQFMSPESMVFSAEKSIQSGAKETWITERGTTFGYNDLVVDVTSVPRLKKATNCPIIMDVTHSLQKPNQSTGYTHGSDKSLSRILMRYAAISGADGIFVECHTDPDKSLSDKETILKIDEAIRWIGEAFSYKQRIDNTYYYEEGDGRNHR